MDETMDEDGVEYDAVPVRCRACEALTASARAFADINEPDPAAGIKWRLEKANGHIA